MTFTNRKAGRAPALGRARAWLREFREGWGADGVVHPEDLPTDRELAGLPYEAAQS